MISFSNDAGETLDYGGDDFSFTREVASFTNGYKIKGDISTSFELPGTAYNRAKLGFSGSNQIGNTALSKIPFNLVKNGNLVRRGFVMIDEDGGEILKCIFLSGNTNWFAAFDFKCTQIRNDKFDSQYNSVSMNARKSATEGIIYPIVDYACAGNKYGNDFNRANAATPVLQVFPCLYVHTLVNELSKIAGVIVSGDLLTDSLFKKLIITPPGPDLVDSSGTALTVGSFIGIESIAPPIQAVDFIKWLCVSFFALPTFDEFSNTLSLNKLDNLQKQNAEDWSNYFVSNVSQYYKMFQHNTIGVEESPDPQIAAYNNVNEIDYGTVDIETDKTDGSTQELYVSPFPPVRDSMSYQPAAAGSVSIAWGNAYVPFYVGEDQTGVTYTSVSSNGGLAQFNGTSFPPSDEQRLFRVVDGLGRYNGYHYSRSGATTTSVISESTFSGTSTGTIYFQNVRKSDKNYVLVCLPNFPVSSMSSVANFIVFGVTSTSVATAYFHKPHYPGLTNLDASRTGLSYGPIVGDRDHSLTEIYGNTASNMLNGPVEQCYFLLPEAVEKNYNFNKLVYLKTKTLNGYFFVSLIENYVDSTTPVRCDLYHVD